MKTLRSSILILATLTASAAFAQQPAPVKAAATAKRDVPCNNDDADTSGLTSCQRMYLSMIGLQMEKLQGPIDEYKALANEARTFVTSIEQDHPGMKYAPPSREFPVGHLVKAPAAPSPTVPMKQTAPTPAAKK